MRAIDLETRVITAVDQIRAGHQVENDFIECKRDWPSDNKARQLAGSLNRAGGDPVIYIIGIDETTGKVHDVSGTDPLNWWTQITPKFDQTPPEMIRHMTVPVAERGEHVVAVAFASDRAPYVVKTGSANPSLEVPMRESTGTRTARRDELLRMLIPAANLPECISLEGFLHAEYSPAAKKGTGLGGQIDDQKESLTCYGQLRVFFAHNGRETVTAPTHGMTGTLHVDDESYQVAVRPRPLPSEKQPSPSAAPIATRDGVTVTTSGAVLLSLSVPDIPVKSREKLKANKEWALEIQMEVLGAVRPLYVTANLSRSRGSSKSANHEVLGNWRYTHSGLQ
ncbi:hypothetical protein StoSoilB3_18710 [Arthrobacter sp. StoSoilB3]|nr:hypothetical protein ASF74_11730 [Arthrobacter sp. Leaf145]BCW40336.1 hypothetical protein StoSoilB3_18710 [Arthrobacter sp. StoSoilB3]